MTMASFTKVDVGGERFCRFEHMTGLPYRRSSNGDYTSEGQGQEDRAKAAEERARKEISDLVQSEFKKRRLGAGPSGISVARPSGSERRGTTPNVIPGSYSAFRGLPEPTSPFVTRDFELDSAGNEVVSLHRTDFKLSSRQVLGF